MHLLVCCAAAIIHFMLKSICIQRGIFAFHWSSKDFQNAEKYAQILFEIEKEIGIILKWIALKQYGKNMTKYLPQA